MNSGTFPRRSSSRIAASRSAKDIPVTRRANSDPVTASLARTGIVGRVPARGLGCAHAQEQHATAISALTARIVRFLVTPVILSLMPRAHTLIALTLSTILCAPATAESINVAAAISLKEALLEIAKQFQADTGHQVKLTFGSSGQLAAQIAQGAPIDAFISAANKQVDDLVKKQQADPATRRIIARNDLVLIVPAKAEKDHTPSRFEDLVDPRYKRVAIGEPKTVPAGQYASQLLDSLKITDSLKNRLVYGANVRQVLDYVTRNEVPAGIVYRTDAQEAPDKVKVTATADPKLHDPIEYPAVVVTASRKKDPAKQFLDYLTTEKAQTTLKARGFIPSPKQPQ
jgi:molybdate transport system substrate-binding protein